MEYAKRLGVSNVEASADTEADPLYMGPEYMEDWTREVSKCGESIGVKVVNLYSGHGTYTTLGLGHPDVRVRERIREYWVKPMLRDGSTAGRRAGILLPRISVGRPSRCGPVCVCAASALR